MRRAKTMPRAGLWASAAAAIVLAACSGGTKATPSPSPTPPPATTTATASPEATATLATPPSATPTATATPSPDTVIDGVPTAPLHVGPPADIPPGVVLYVEGGCTYCDGPATSLDRVYRDGAGVLHSDRLFERKLRFDPATNTTYEEKAIRTLRVSSNGNDIVIGVCEHGYCGGVGNATDDALTVFYQSNDGGVTWKVMGELAGDTSLVAVMGKNAMVRQVYRPSPGAPWTWRIVQLPSGEPVTVDPAIDLKTANIVTVGDGTPLAVAPDVSRCSGCRGRSTARPGWGRSCPRAPRSTMRASRPAAATSAWPSCSTTAASR